MNVTITQVSSLEKIRSAADLTCGTVRRQRVLAGQRVCWQLCAVTDTGANAALSLDAPPEIQAKLFSVKKVNMDVPVTARDLDREEDYLSFEPGLMPDLLVPAADQNHRTFLVPGDVNTLFIRADVPADCKPGSYPVTVTYRISQGFGTAAEKILSETFTIQVVDHVLPEQSLIYTRWFYADCIADYHQVPVYSQAHWELIDKYIAAAAESGINMLLVPIHTPPLDTAVGIRRTCVQLVDIEKNGEAYTFRFEKFHRFISLCKKHGIRHFEMAHLFSQWGAQFAPNILVAENGVKQYLFGWHVAADSPEYLRFLDQYLPALCAQLEVEGIAENTYFHISDEPALDAIHRYKAAHDRIRPLIGNCKTLDALSKVEFYDQGLVPCPVTPINRMDPFLERNIPNRWCYYCVDQQKQVSNSFLADPSYRIRVLGFQMYRHNIKGFLQWGYNFYSSPASFYPINPYVTTSADGYFPSGDSFIVYPGPNCVYPSLRSEVFYDALQDMRICQALEQIIGRDQVVAMIDDAAGYPLTFDHYPRGGTFLENLRSAMIQKLVE